ncbi:hypothetical protein ERX46_02840 [Brumimicrobium glaciale]|uniref:Uncharacterized protein n=1 Tax=Brumimicrobium glaciale TaxID=200475 RepID=A0A4Q4KQP8_9FLAO|nr:hypothetical protein [Brumimicrobium glaciale]RYM35948.1 hypothetical protein ERX46_02840 [Brumimicrobium glaciale]
MKQTKIIIASLILVFGLGFSSCKKEGCTDPVATNYNAEAEKDDGSCEFAPAGPTSAAPGSYSPSFAGEFGALIAIKTITTSESPFGTVDTELGTAVAVFSVNSGSSFVGAGNVTVDGEGLTLQENKSYVYLPSQINPLGLTFGSTVNWEGTGSTWEAFTTSTNQDFSYVDPITSGDISKSNDYILTSGSIANADSILYAVYGSSGNKLVIVAGNNTSHTFTASELSGLGEGSGYAQVVGLNYDQKVIGTKDYWLINETVRTKTINVKP